MDLHCQNMIKMSHEQERDQKMIFQSADSDFDFCVRMGVHNRRLLNSWTAECCGAAHCTALHGRLRYHSPMSSLELERDGMGYGSSLKWTRSSITSTINCCCGKESTRVPMGSRFELERLTFFSHHLTSNFTDGPYHAPTHTLCTQSIIFSGIGGKSKRGK